MRLAPSTLVDLMDDDEGPFAATALIGTHAVDMDADELRKAYDDAVSEMLEGRRMLDETALVVKEGGGASVDPITAEIVLALGIDPIAAAAISERIEDTVDVIDQHGGTVAQIDVQPWGGTTPVTVTIGPGVTWNGNGIRAPLPAAACATARGRMLSEIVSHPVLDRHPLRIADVERDANGIATMTFGHTLGLLTDLELVAMRDRRFRREETGKA